MTVDLNKIKDIYPFKNNYFQVSEKVKLHYVDEGEGNPVIFVHGIQGSWLKDEYPVDYDKAVVWTGVLKKKFDALHLHRLDGTVDTEVNRLIMPHQVVPMIYDGIIDEIRDEMEGQPYAYAFTYDWRKDNRLSARSLAEFIERVLLIAGVHERSAGRKPPRQVVLLGPLPVQQGP